MTLAHPSTYAKTTPGKAAYISVDTGHVMTYAELDRYSSKGANLFRSLGVKPGEHIAILSENHPEFFALIWSAQRAGIIFTAVSSHLKAKEVAYIVDNCDAKVLVVTKKLEAIAKEAVSLMERNIYVLSTGPSKVFENWHVALEDMPEEPTAPECAGVHMLYSSGTTGHPKGVYPPWAPDRPIDHIEPGMANLRDFFGINADTIYLSPAPLYHAAPLIFNQLVMFQGGTSIIMEKFDPERALHLIDRYGVNMAQFVPIMFVRMLKLDPEIRAKYNMSSLKKALHAAAPCPVKIKQQMIDWWGPVIFEYYSSTENAGATLLNTEQWLAHPGSVGMPLGCTVHILDESGQELPAGEIGEVYFENPRANFEYYKEPEKTAQTRNEQGWITVGDMGYVDEEGFLYLSDRKDFMIISGGVNIYPQEIENQLLLHPKVADVAVFGIPNEEFGQEVKAVIQPLEKDYDEDALAKELMAWCKENISSVKCPRSIDFDPALPRLDNGKLYKNKIADAYQSNKG